MYENSTQEITLYPNSTQVQGQSFYFSIVVKETNSNTVMQPYFCTVKVGGEKIFVNNTINYTDVSYSINWINSHHASIKFNTDVNITWLLDDNRIQDEFFNVSWTDTDFRQT